MKIYFVTVLSVLLTMVYCANQAPPSGGPVDKTPPTVAAQFPQNGQVNVDTRAAVEIRFSEWINRSSAAGAVSVYPAVTKGVTVRAVKNRLTVTPKEPLSGGTTYHVSISAALQDLRGNAIPKPIDIVFSTGPELDSGRVDGVIVPLKSKAAGQRVMLFRADSGWTDGRYFSPPDYAVQSDSAGAFGFSHIKEGSYRIAAFADQYKTGKLRVGDTCFTSIDQIVGVSKSAQTIKLYPADGDTSTVKKKTSVDSVSADTSVIDTSQKAAVDTVGIDTVNTSLKKSVIDTAADSVGIDKSKKRRAADTAAICTRLSGGASCLPPDSARKWVYRPLARRDTSFTVRDSAGTFAFDSIPASKGILLWFIDDNDDNAITPGKLSPWRRPERFFVVPDTVEAKARWIVEGLNVRACE